MSQTANPHGNPHGNPHAGLILERMALAPASKRLRAVFGGEVIADSTEALVLNEKGYPPRIYVPPAEIIAMGVTISTPASLLIRARSS